MINREKLLNEDYPRKRFLTKVFCPIFKMCLYLQNPSPVSVRFPVCKRVVQH